MKQIVKSACRMCHGGCGVLVHVSDGRVVKVEGNPDSPLNRGRMCVKGRASLEQLYHPDRLTHPLKRIGDRGQGNWARISWDEALELIAVKIRASISQNGPESIAVGTGTGRHHFHHVLRFANALGTPNWCEPGTAQCFIPRILTGVMTFGDLPVCDYYGDVNPGCLLVWGHNPTVTGPDGEIQFRVRDCLKKGTRLIVIDPRRTELAGQADLWLQIRPGADDALALAIIQVIIAEQLFDAEFVGKWTTGFEALAERVRETTPEWAEPVTWIPAEKIREAARLFAQTKPAALEWGVALEHTPNCLQTVRAAALLPALTGNIDVPGGWILGMHGLNPLPIFMDNLSPEMKQKRLGADSFGVLSGPSALFPSAHAPSVFRAMRTGEPYPINTFLVFGNNALATYANSVEVYRSLMALDFLAVMDLYMTPTAELADVVLPAASWLEVDEVVGLPYVAENVILAQQKILRIGECRSDEEVFIDLAARLDLPVGREPLEDVYNKQLSSRGLTFQELKEKGHIEIPIVYKKYEQTGFMTGSGKVELAASYLETLGYDPLPFYQEPPESPVSRPDLLELYPLVLTTGARSRYYFHSEYRQLNSLRQRRPDPIMEIHPAAAAGRGIEDGDWVWIETRRGRIRQRARLTDGLDPRVVSIQHGWWFPEEPGPDYGIWKSNANLLTDNSPPYDPAMGTYQLRALLCQVYLEDSE